MNSITTIKRTFLLCLLGVFSLSFTACKHTDDRIYTTGGDYSSYDYPYSGDGYAGDQYYDYQDTTVYTSSPRVISVPPVRTINRNTTVYIDDRDRYNPHRRDWDRRDRDRRDWDRRGDRNDRDRWDRKDRDNRGNWNRDSRRGDDNRPNPAFWEGKNDTSRPHNPRPTQARDNQPDRVVTRDRTVTKEWDRDRPKPTPRNADQQPSRPRPVIQEANHRPQNRLVPTPLKPENARDDNRDLAKPPHQEAPHRPNRLIPTPLKPENSQ